MNRKESQRALDELQGIIQEGRAYFSSAHLTQEIIRRAGVSVGHNWCWAQSSRRGLDLPLLDPNEKKAVTEAFKWAGAKGLGSSQLDGLSEAARRQVAQSLPEYLRERCLRFGILSASRRTDDGQAMCIKCHTWMPEACINTKLYCPVCAEAAQRENHPLKVGHRMQARILTLHASGLSKEEIRDLHGINMVAIHLAINGPFIRKRRPRLTAWQDWVMDSMGL